MWASASRGHVIPEFSHTLQITIPTLQAKPKSTHIKSRCARNSVASTNGACFDVKFSIWTTSLFITFESPRRTLSHPRKLQHLFNHHNVVRNTSGFGHVCFESFLSIKLDQQLSIMFAISASHSLVRSAIRVDRKGGRKRVCKRSTSCFNLSSSRMGMCQIEQNPTVCCATDPNLVEISVSSFLFPAAM